MILTRARSLALSFGLMFAPLAVAAANPDAATADTPPAAEETSPQPDAETSDSPAIEPAAEDKRICRYVRLDTASRRKTKLCRTTEEWRELNNPR